GFGVFGVLTLMKSLISAKEALPLVLPSCMRVPCIRHAGHAALSFLPLRFERCSDRCKSCRGLLRVMTDQIFSAALHRHFDAVAKRLFQGVAQLLLTPSFKKCLWISEITPI